MNFVSFIRFVAAVLITNSHFDALYPAGFSWLSTGGALGNALFFFVSGWTLYLSRRSNFAEWIVRRYTRIFPSAWIFYLCVLAAGAGTYAVADFLTLSPHWFLNAIVVFYPVFFFITKFFEKRLLWFVALTAIPLAGTFFALPHEGYILESGTLCLRWYAYFAIMLLGAFAARNRETLFGGSAPVKKKCVILEMGGGITCLAAHYLVQWATPRFGVPEIQLAAPIFLAGTTFCFFFAARDFCRVITFPPFLQKPISGLSALTLEIYLVQFLIIECCADFSFPAGFCSAALLIASSAFVLNHVAGKVREIFFEPAGTPVLLRK